MKVAKGYWNAWIIVSLFGLMWTKENHTKHSFVQKWPMTDCYFWHWLNVKCQVIYVSIGKSVFVLNACILQVLCNVFWRKGKEQIVTYRPPHLSWVTFSICIPLLCLNLAPCAFLLCKNSSTMSIVHQLSTSLPIARNLLQSSTNISTSDSVKRADYRQWMVNPFCCTDVW